MEKYELDWTRYHPGNHHYTVIAILTGLPIEEIEAVSPVADCWGGQRFVEVFRKLGFNVNRRFKKFDPDTEYPCLMRHKRTDIKEPYWYLEVYYDGKVYGGNSYYTLEDWMKQYPQCKITSMLQVWI